MKRYYRLHSLLMREVEVHGPRKTAQTLTQYDVQLTTQTQLPLGTQVAASQPRRTLGDPAELRGYGTAYFFGSPLFAASMYSAVLRHRSALIEKLPGAWVRVADALTNELRNLHREGNH